MLDPRAILKEANGGLAPKDVIDVAVKPTGFSSESRSVITETPDACNLNVARSASVGSFSVANLSMTLFLQLN